jgi:hypothetical protein
LTFDHPGAVGVTLTLFEANLLAAVLQASVDGYDEFEDYQTRKAAALERYAEVLKATRFRREFKAVLPPKDGAKSKKEVADAFLLS